MAEAAPERDFSYWFNLAQQRQSRGDYDGAALAYDEAGKVGADAAQRGLAKLSLASLLEQEGEAGNAEDGFRAAMDEGDPEIKARAGLPLAELQIAANRPFDARSTLQEVIDARVAELSPNGALRLGRLSIDQFSEYEPAANALRTAIEDGGRDTSAIATALLGVALQRQGLTDQAARAFRQAARSGVLEADEVARRGLEELGLPLDETPPDGPPEASSASQEAPPDEQSTGLRSGDVGQWSPNVGGPDSPLAAETAKIAPPPTPRPARKGRRRPARPRPIARASYNSDSVRGEAELDDHLNMRNEVNALCAVIAANDVEPPLSVGLFGDWGSGKSYFMQLMDRRISKLAQQSRSAIEKGQPTAFYPHIRQIWFNAWHYIDANLWASLVTHIFEELVKPEDDSTRAASKARSDQKALARELETSKALINDATTAQENARATIEKRETELAQAKRTRILIGSYLREHRIARTAFGVAITLLVVAAGLFVIQPEWVTRGVQWLVAASSAAIGAYGAFKTRILSRLREAGQDSKVVREFVGSHRMQRSEKLQQEIELLKGQEARLQREIDDASRRMHVAEGEIEDIKKGRRLHKYIQERARSSDYQEYLGLIALVRRDFEHLSKLLDEGRKARVEERKANGKEQGSADASQLGEPPLPAIDRVVLYIDDLDRCPADRVVQVLEAVHLLLAFELFVVVVGVDSRWLFRSLERHYSNQLRQPRDGVPTSGQDDSYWASTPQNYLEKIFQIPFSIRRMPRGGYERLIDSLLKAEIDRSGLQVVTDESPVGHGDGGRPARVPASGPLVPSGGAPLDAPSLSSTGEGASASQAPTQDASNTTSIGDEETVDLNPGALRVTEVEVAFMKELSELVATPRAAKRMVNTYRLIRAMLDDDDLERFVPDDDGRGEYAVVQLLLAVLAGSPAQARALFGALSESPAGDWNAFVEELGAKKGPAYETHEWARLCGALHDINEATVEIPDEAAVEELVPEDLEVFKDWVPRVARYSFQTGVLAATEESDDEEPGPQPVQADAPE